MIKTATGDSPAGDTAKPPTPNTQPAAGAREQAAAAPQVPRQVPRPSGNGDEHPARQGAADSERNGNQPNAAPRPSPPPWQRPPVLAPLAASPPPPPHSNGDQRRTLHLSLGNPGHGNGGSHAAEPQPQTLERPHFTPGAQPIQTGPISPDRSLNGAPLNGAAEPRQPPHYPAVPRSDAETGQRKENGNSFIDQELRARVEGDIAAFLGAFDGALAQDTPESRTALREATDRLLRAGARTRIELERLEARFPLPARDHGARGNPAWRDR